MTVAAVLVDDLDLDGVRVVDERLGDVFDQFLGCHRSRPYLAAGRMPACAEQAGDGVGRLGALGEPGLGLVGVDLELDRLGARVVVAERLDATAVAGAAAVGDDDTIGRLLRRADAREPDADCHGWFGSSSDGGDAWASRRYLTVMMAVMVEVAADRARRDERVERRRGTA